MSDGSIKDSSQSPVLEIEKLSVSYRVGSREFLAAEDVSLTLLQGQTVAVVGESGSGKTTTAHAVIRLLPGNARVVSGRILFGNLDLVRASARQMRTLRGRRIGLIPQDPGISLDPLQRIGGQVSEPIRIHRLGRRDQFDDTVYQLLQQAGLPDAERVAHSYPHELSGGMRQRVLIAIALACKPQLVIADEPTSALDVTVQKTILDQIDQLKQEHRLSMLFITHDLGVAADRSDHIVVMQRGHVVESGPTSQVLREPQHPYTSRLLENSLSLRPKTLQARSQKAQGDPLLAASALRRTFSARQSSGGSVKIVAVDDVSFELRRGETLAMVGESGSGKSTTARLVMGLDRPDSGSVRFDGNDIATVRAGGLRRLRQRFQMVYQNPLNSLDPRMTVSAIIREPMQMFRVADGAEQHREVARLLDRVALPPDTATRRPRELSGGQQQRVAIARALASNPDLVVCDEALSALDATAQAQVLELLAELQRERSLAYLFISHDMSVVREIADRIAVMRHGKIVETGTVYDVFSDPQHPYTRELLSSTPGRRLQISAELKNSATNNDPTRTNRLNSST